MSDPQPWQWSIPRYFNIGVACTDAHLATRAGERTAMIVEDEESGVSRATFAELARQTDRFAQLLRELQVDAGERVLIRLSNSLDFPIAFLGSMKRGAIAVPSSTLLVAEEVAYLARDAGASVIVTDKSMWPELGAELAGVEGLRHLLLAGNGAMPAQHGPIQMHDLKRALAAIETCRPPHPTLAEDPAYLVYTSGTTGHPKGVLHAHRALLGRTPSNSHWFDFKEGDRVLHSGKFNWTYVLGTGLMDPFLNAKTVVVYEGANTPETWPRLIDRHSCTIFVGVPTIYRQILQKTAFSAADLPSLRHCMSAGETLPEPILSAWKARFGVDIYEAMGMSELSYYISQSVHHPLRPGSVGRPQPGHDVTLLDEELRPVTPGREGMIALPATDPGKFLEYWGQPRETARVHRGGYFLTGDYARQDADGYIWFLGRHDDIINSFGYRISPQEIERVMKAHPAIGECIAIGQQVASGKVLVALCVVCQSDCAVDEAELLAYAGEHLAGYKRPRLIHFMQEFPRTGNGKVIRKALQRVVATRQYAASNPPVTPTTGCDPH
ncbi:MAG: acyl-CoA synthetase [Gammaproteobacteria bacterium]|nr:acyl-CoA synthetase [Gammaproteobacteria bacterium]